MRRAFKLLFSFAIAGFHFILVSATCVAQNGNSGTNNHSYSVMNPKAPADAVVVYVTPTGAGLLDGSSWLNAYPGTDVQTAIDKMGITEVWIKKGTYKPTSGTDRAISFQMKIGVGIYGGFAGTETMLTERVNFGLGQVNETILSGDIGTENENTDNSYHLFYHSTYLDGSAVLDGFTIKSGNADFFLSGHDCGGGMYNYNSSPTLSNCTFISNIASNDGGGMYNTYYSSPTLTNCTFTSNTAGDILHGGGGMYNSLSSPSLINSAFASNVASTAGGGMYNTASSPSLTNCTLANNTTGNSGTGGGMYNTASSPSLTNCTLTRNSAGFGGGGGGMYNTGSSPVLKNCIIWENTASFGNGFQFYITGTGNTTLNYSCYSSFPDGQVYVSFTASFTANNSISFDPYFANADNNDYRLYSASPCVNAGNNSYNTQPKDIRGQNRIQNDVVDIGAYEWTMNVDPFSSLYWYGSVDNNWNTLGNWSNYVIPSASLDVVINADGITNFPEISGDEAICHNLSINSGASLSVKNVGKLKVNGTLTNSAGKYLAQSLVLAKAIDKKESVAKVSYDLGNLYRNADEYPKSLQNLLVALNYWEMANDSANLILVNYSLGATYQQMGNTAKSLLYSEFAMKLALKVNKAAYLPEIYNNLGILYWKNIGKLDSARYYMTLALEKSILLADPSKAVITLTNLGGIESSYKNPKKALAYYQQALNLQQKGANLNTESGLFINIGEVYHQLKIDDSARYYNEKGLEIARKINAKEWMRNAYYNLFTIDSAHRNFDSALLNYRQFEAITDSITSKEIEHEIADLTLKYETDKKEKTIQFLENEQELKTIQIKSQKQSKYLFLILFCGAAISIIAIIFERRWKNRAYKMLVKKNIELTDFEEELLSILAFACQQSDQLSNLRIVARYSASPLSDSQKENLIIEVMDLFDARKTYLQPDITLALLAEELKVSRNYLSQVINEKFHQNFSDFINELRIKEARKLLIDKKNSNLTIQAIANSVGFNSMSSFISAFKRYTGVTPSFFLKSNIEAE